MKNDRKIRVLVADDHPVVREGLCSLVNRQDDMKVVAEAGTGREAFEQFLRHKPDVALIDLRMPEMSGTEAIAAIREQIPAAQAVVITTYSGDEDVYQSLRAGAKAYLLKDAPRDELLSCIRAVHEGRTWISSEAAAHLASRMSTRQLSPRELEVLRMMATGKSNKEIGAALHVTEGTIKMHVNHILKKLEVAGRGEAISQAIKRGIVHVG